MEASKGFKSDRILYMYDKLIFGEVLNKNELSVRFGVSEKSIQRDIDALRCYLAEKRKHIFNLVSSNFKYIRRFGLKRKADET